MKRIENARIVFFDLGPVMRLLEFNAEYYPIVSQVLDLIYEKKIQMIASPVTLYSVCYRALLHGDTALARQYREFFTRSVGFSLREIDSEIALAAAEFRARHSVSFEESLQLATAFHCGADYVITENESWKVFLDTQVVTLNDLKGAP
jgi:predicted nucleic acid-binding protein